MKQHIRRFGVAIALVILGSAAQAQPPTTVVDVPAGAVWIRHLRQDLLPFWLHPDALGRPVGRFPTFRCNDGSRYRPASPCPELADPPAWIKPELGRHYVRMQSRQTFVYAVGFHLTGDRRLLRLALAGANDIRARALDRASGSVATYYEDGQAGPAIGERTAQDLAYAGLAWPWRACITWIAIRRCWTIWIGCMSN